MAERPHVLIFNPDQFRSDALGHLGNRANPTPVIDELVATEAVSFHSAFCQNPVCTPSRCSFMTGWYPHVHGHRTMFHMLHPERGQPNLLRLLKQSGYHVWWAGKNDLVPAQDGFEAHCDERFKPTAENYARWGHQPRPGLHSWTEWRGDPNGDNYYSFHAGRLPTGNDDIYCDGDWANVLGAIDFITSYSGEKPLCIYLPLTYPHPPYGVEEPWFSRIPRDLLPERITESADPASASKPKILEALREGQRLQSWDEARFTELRATYYGMCARIDAQFGLVLDALREAGIYDDTAAFFLSDHGDFTGDCGLVEKTQNTFEDVLTRVPLVVKPPRSTAGEPLQVVPGIRDALVELVDFPATVFELAQIEPGYRYFGRSLMPLLTGSTTRHREEVHCEGGRLPGEEEAMEKPSLAAYDDPAQSLYYPRSRLQGSDDDVWHMKATMIRTHRYKYVRRLYEHDELYDLEADPGETRNIIHDPSVSARLTDLKERMLAWYQKTCDVVPFELDRRA
jgi:arylsulfatase A-like enzyme